MIHLGPQAHQLREEHMCARGGGGLSAHNAGLAVGSIGSGGSQREPRHGCVSIERSRLDSHLQSSFHGAPCASLTTFVVLRRISATHPPILAIIQPYRLLCAQTNTNPSAFSSLSRRTALHRAALVLAGLPFLRSPHP